MPQRSRRVLMLGLASLACLSSLLVALPSAARDASGGVQRSQMIAECENVYRYVPTPMSWAAARDAARAMGSGAHLATIASWDENVCVRMSITLIASACAMSVRLGGCLPEIAWLGGSDSRAEGIWRWLGTSGSGGGVFFSEFRTVAGYENWSPGEPNDSDPGEDCLLMFIDDASWNDGTCDSPMGFVVEFERRTPRRGNLPL